MQTALNSQRRSRASIEAFTFRCFPKGPGPPKPGEGPSPDDQEKGFYDLRFVGKTTDGKTMITKVTGDRDPGYGSTSKMLGEAGLCLAFDVKEDVKGGFWTPASALDGKLLERLQANAGLTFEVVETR